MFYTQPSNSVVKKMSDDMFVAAAVMFKKKNGRKMRTRSKWTKIGYLKFSLSRQLTVNIEIGTRRLV